MDIDGVGRFFHLQIQVVATDVCQSGFGIAAFHHDRLAGIRDEKSAVVDTVPPYQRIDNCEMVICAVCFQLRVAVQEICQFALRAASR